MAQGALYNMKIFHQKTEMKLKVGTSNVLVWGHNVYGAEIWTLRKSK
jgi:hypothetical protein